MTADKPLVVLSGGSRFRLSLFDLGLACCAVEFVAASVMTEDLPEHVPVEEANVLIVSGTVTDVSAPAVLRAYEALAEPRYVVSFGACSNTGGPYWDSYAVTKGVDQLVPVDLYVPGCPPRPEALLAALAQLG